MRIFVYEHITGGGLAAQPLPPSLAREGDLMLRALLDDLMDLPGAKVFTTRDARLAPLPATPVVQAQAGEPIDDLFVRCCAMADAVWPIAPETDGVLERLSRRITASGRILLGSRPAAIQTTGSKHRTARALESAGVPAVPTYLTLADVPGHVDRLVVKPDDGAGCLDTWLMDRAQAGAWCAAHGSSGHVLQPLVAGDALSVSLLCHDGQGQLLSVNEQRVAVEDGAFHFTGVRVGARADDGGVYAQLASRVAAAIPGLWGYVGVDIIDTASGPVVVDVNPRLTTAYADLRRVLGSNPAALVFRLAGLVAGEAAKDAHAA